jgi:hypothetical protein
MTYIVQRLIGNEWECGCFEFDTQPATFATREEAQADLDEEMRLQREANMDPNPAEWRVHEVGPSTIRLWNVTFCANNIGVWDREWFHTEEEAKAFRRAFVQQWGESQEQDGTCGDCYQPEAVDIEPTAEGLLAFASNYAVDQS